MIFKGFVDLHIHGLGKFSTRTENPGEVLGLAKELFKRGTAAFLPTIYSGPLDVMRSNMQAVAQAMELQHSTPNPCALILGVHLEGPFLNPVRCGALDPGTFMRPSISSMKKLLSGYESIVKIITIAPELTGALKVIEECSKLGIRINMGHSDASREEARNGKKAGALGVTHIFNAMRPFHHRDPGLVGLALLDEDIYIEVISDGVHLHRATLELIFGLKRLDRIMLVSDSVQSGRKQGRAIMKCEGSIAGSVFSLSKSVEILENIHVPDGEIIEAGRENPCRYIGVNLD